MKKKNAIHSLFDLQKCKHTYIHIHTHTHTHTHKLDNTHPMHARKESELTAETSCNRHFQFCLSTATTAATTTVECTRAQERWCMHASGTFDGVDSNIIMKVFGHHHPAPGRGHKISQGGRITFGSGRRGGSCSATGSGGCCCSWR